jgi:hypothetical protein
MKIYKGDTIEFLYGTSSKIRGKVLSFNERANAHIVKVIKSNASVIYVGEIAQVSNHNYFFKTISVVKRGWIGKHKKNLWQRLVYLFTNKFV